MTAAPFAACSSLQVFGRVIAVLAWCLAAALLPVTAGAATAGDAAAAAPLSPPAGQPGQRRQGVLILVGGQYGIPVSDALIARTVATLRDKGVAGTDIVVEHLDLIRQRSAAWRQKLAGMLADKLSGMDVVLVLAQDPLALGFLAQEGSGLLAPQTPVLATLTTTPEVVWHGTPHPLLNITNQGDIAGTVGLGFRLFPRASRLFVIAGATEEERQFQDQAAQALAALPAAPALESSVGLSYEQMLQRVATLPPDTLVLLVPYFSDGTGRRFLPVEVAAAVAGRANAPVLGVYDLRIWQGLTAGVVIDPLAVGQRAGELAFEILSGARRLDAPVAEAPWPAQPMADWAQLQRWRADPAGLPADTVLLNRPQTLWGAYRNTVIAGAGAIGVLIALVVALAAQNRRRQRAERDLRDAAGRLQATLNALPDLMFRLRRDGLIEEFHSSATHKLYLPPAEFIGRRVRDVIPAPAAGVIEAAIEEAARTGASRGGTYSLPIAGEELWFEISTSATAAADDGAAHFLLLVRDITPRKRAEQALDAHRQGLEARVQERTAALHEAMRKAEAANLAKSAFLANMSHEIRTPLNAIIGMSHLIRQSGLAPVQAERLDKLNGAAMHLLEILNAILDLSKIDAGKLTLEELPLRLEALVANTVSMLEDRARAKGLRLDSEVDRMPRGLVGDPTRLQQALLNYAHNAIKFTEAGRITLRVRMLEQTADHALVRFEVQDTGIGIDAQAIDRLFVSFQQADSSITRRAGGTGLGLVITKKLAELMGGDAGVSSSPGVGSVFWFTARLRQVQQPAAAEPAPQAPSVLARLRARHAGARLLVVEDNEINREVAQAILEDAGLVVDLAVDGVEAVAKVTANPYRLVLMDMQMPRMDGLQASREIRKTHSPEVLPIVAMTANAFGDDKARCLQAGMDDFVSKPVDADFLYQVVLGWLDSAGSRADRS